MANNEFLVNRVASAAMPVTINTAGPNTVYGSVIIPAGAIVTGATIVHTSAPTVANAANTICLYAGTGLPLMAVTAISDLGGTISIPQAMTLLTAAGMYVSNAGELMLKCGVSNGTASWTFRPDVYVGYIKG